MKNSIINIKALGFPWETQSPFLFCVYHLDKYPAGNNKFGPVDSLAGRQIGNDFVIKDGWRMYHGNEVPGFPAHPHRGFETVTVVLKGLVDHSDSLGGAGRYGQGDVQWMTAGRGLQHSEMFPLLKQKEDNPLELFQIWINLPAKNKFVDPNYAMLWKEDIPKLLSEDGKVEVKIVAGNYKNAKTPTLPGDSWAADLENEVAVWIIKLSPGCSWEIPAASKGLNRSLYFYAGDSITVEDQMIRPNQVIHLLSDLPTQVKNGNEEGFMLLLQGRPINEPLAQFGPFVMNSQKEIQEAMSDFRKTRFGGWPWPSSEPVHDPSKGRFAHYVNGETEIK